MEQQTAASPPHESTTAATNATPFIVDETHAAGLVSHAHVCTAGELSWQQTSAAPGLPPVGVLPLLHAAMQQR